MVLLDTFFHEDKRYSKDESIEIIAFGKDEKPKSGIYVDVYFPRLEKYLWVDAGFVFTPEQIKILKDSRRGQTFFEMFKYGEHYGI